MSRSAMQRLMPALLEAAGVFALAFFGADAMFGAELGPMSVAATLPAALGATLMVLAFRLSE